MSVNIKDFEYAFKLRINYKSGNSVEAWFLKFKYDGSTRYEYIEANPKKTILKFGAPEVESIWQVDYCKFVPTLFGWNEDGTPNLD